MAWHFENLYPGPMVFHLPRVSWEKSMEKKSGCQTWDLGAKPWIPKIWPGGAQKRGTPPNLGSYNQWIILVLVLGGSDYLYNHPGRFFDYTWYISGIYC